MTSALEKQIERIEAKVKAQPGGSVSLWLAALLQSPEENEVTLNAASLLLLEDILDAPEPHLWDKLAQRMNSDCSTWPDIRLWFTAAHQDLTGDENFDDEEGQEALCYLARVYYEVFHVLAPAPSDKRRRDRREDELNRVFIRPLLARACPEIDAYSADTHTAWLQKVLDAPEHPESNLASLRQYVEEVKDTA